MAGAIKRAAKVATGRAFLKALGWTLSGEKPDAQKYVLIAAPHTSNWDMPIMMAIAFAFDADIQWMGKHTIFEGPAGYLFRSLGGVPIVRHSPKGIVEQMVERFGESEALVLTVATEGTRARTPHWKNGFYRIARDANVPVVLAFLDYPNKRGGYGPAIHLTGDVRADMDRIRAFYADKVGKFPEKFGEVRLREESE